MNTVAGWAIGERRPEVLPVPLVLLISLESHFELLVKSRSEPLAETRLRFDQDVLIAPVASS